MIQDVQIESIVVYKGRKLRANANVQALAESIEALGLLQPIVLTDDYVLVAGLTRIHAMQYLGRKTITATFVDPDDLKARLAEIDENLLHNPLTALERASQLAERKKIYEAMHPETKHGGDHPQVASAHNDHLVPRFTSVMASITGSSESTIKRDVALAEGIEDDVKEAISDTPVADKKSELKELALLPSGEQRAVAKKLKSGEAKTVKEATGASPDLKKNARAISGQLSRALVKLGIAEKCNAPLTAINCAIAKA